MSLPPARKRPCHECPWRRVSLSGWLGPWTVDEWLALAHSDEPIACHTSIEVDDEWTENTLQCAGAATYRANVCKLPRDPEVAIYPADREGIFASRAEFGDHHGRS